MLRLILAVLLLVPSVTFGATIFIDSNLGTNCTAGTYSITNRNCTGSDGNAYTTIGSAYSASGTNDTIYVRTGTYTNMSGSDGIAIKDGQTWQTYPGDMPNRATINAEGSTNLRIFVYDNMRNGTIKDFILSGGRHSTIYVAYTENFHLENLDVCCNNTDNILEGHQISISDCCGPGFHGPPPAVQYTQNGIVRNI